MKRVQRDDPHEGVVHVGGRAFVYTRERAVQLIESGAVMFYVLADGRRTNLSVYTGPHGKYLRGQRDGDWNDDLLTLPDCNH